MTSRQCNLEFPDSFADLRSWSTCMSCESSSIMLASQFLMRGLLSVLQMNGICSTRMKFMVGRHPPVMCRRTLAFSCTLTFTACVQEKGQSEPTWLEGLALISRSPTIHPGDAQYATAIGRPPRGSVLERHPLPNILVFSVKGTSSRKAFISPLNPHRHVPGERDLPSQLGGGVRNMRTQKGVLCSFVPSAQVTLMAIFTVLSLPPMRTSSWWVGPTQGSMTVRRFANGPIAADFSYRSSCRQKGSQSTCSD